MIEIGFDLLKDLSKSNLYFAQATLWYFYSRFTKKRLINLTKRDSETCIVTTLQQINTYKCPSNVEIIEEVRRICLHSPLEVQCVTNENQILLDISKHDDTGYS